MQLITLENTHWQTGVLPQTGGSLAFGRVRTSEGWRDLLRPTPEADYPNASRCSSFIMLPWCNRIRDGLLRYNGATYPLALGAGERTARHGDVRGRAWRVIAQTQTSVTLAFDSGDVADLNWPFAFTAEAQYALDGPTFTWSLTLTNADARAFPAGFGHHPYFVRPAGDAAPLLTVPCDSMFALVDNMAVAAPVPVAPELDFRAPRVVDGAQPLDHLLTGRIADQPAQLHYPALGLSLEMHADPIFGHVLVYTPAGQSSLAVEPMTNASDGFNLFADGVPGSGVFVLEPGGRAHGAVHWRLKTPSA